MESAKPNAVPKPDRFNRRLKELRSSLQNRNLARLAEATGSEWQAAGDKGEYRLLYWSRPVRVAVPEWEVYTGDPSVLASDFEQTMLLYYFTIADGTPIQGSWISFSELPDGKFYTQAFQGYTGRELSAAFGSDLAAFEKSCLELNGSRQELGNAAYIFQALPRVPMLVVYWLGDEDFHESAQVLFDASVSHYLTTDACAILGSTLTRRIISAKRKS